MKKIGLKWYIITGILLAYIVFMVLKINGVFDYTSRFGIEWIRDQEGYNSVMMIDDDVETTWGLLTEFAVGSQVVMKFKGIRSFSEISVLNVSEESTVPMSVYVSTDGDNFTRCESDSGVEGQTTVYTLHGDVSGGYIMFVYEGSDAGHWPITEVTIK